MIFLPDQEVSIWSPDIADIDWTGLVSGPFYVRLCCFKICHHFIYSLVHKFSPGPLKKKKKKKKNSTERKLPQSQPDLFPGSHTGSSPELSKIQPQAPWLLFFFLGGGGVLQSDLGIPTGAGHPAYL